MRKKKPEEKINRFKGDYKGLSLDKLVTRQGSIDILKSPSRIGNSLFYPDGHIEKIEVKDD